jgi:hypothetical protein
VQKDTYGDSELEDLGGPRPDGWQPLWDPSQIPSHPPKWTEFRQSQLNPDGGEVVVLLHTLVCVAGAASDCKLCTSSTHAHVWVCPHPPLIPVLGGAPFLTPNPRPMHVAVATASSARMGAGRSAGPGRTGLQPNATPWASTLTTVTDCKVCHPDMCLNRIRTRGRE